MTLIQKRFKPVRKRKFIVIETNEATTLETEYGAFWTVVYCKDKKLYT